jgi:hypothetical protein
VLYELFRQPTHRLGRGPTTGGPVNTSLDTPAHLPAVRGAM